MAHPSSSGPAHCYTNPSFCRQSEYMPGDRVNEELPPPPQFQVNDELPPPSPSPPPPPPLPQQHLQRKQQQSGIKNETLYNVGQTNPGFQYRSEHIDVPRSNDRYCYLNDGRQSSNGTTTKFQENYVIQSNERRPIMHEREVRSRYEYIIDEDENCLDDEKIMTNNSRVQTPDELMTLRDNGRSGSSRYAFIDNPSNVIQRNDNVPAVFAYQRRENLRTGDLSRYAIVPVNSMDDEQSSKDNNGTWNSSGRNALTPVVLCQRSNSTRGRYARVPTQEVSDPPLLPDRNARERQQLIMRHQDDINCISPKNNVATQKLHEILTTPRKPRSRSEERTLSPSKRQQQQFVGGVVQRGTITPTGSPSGRFVSSPSRATAATPNGRRDQRQMVQASTPRGGDSSPNGPHTSTPNKEPSARRCLPLNLDNSTTSRPRDIRDSPSCPANNCGRLRYSQRGPSGQCNSTSYGIVGSPPSEPPPRYAYLDGFSESIPMVSGSPRYQVVPASDEKSVESAFIARTAVVPPLSPPNSEANTTLASGMEKNDRRNAPLLLLLVGILTCGLALYLSWSQGRRYYLDSAAGCGACCALAGACRSLRRTWTGLGLAGLSALSCAGLLIIASKAPRSGTPLHDVTAGALCGVSLLGAGLALIALLSPKCNIARHRRVHSWIPRFSP